MRRYSRSCALMSWLVGGCFVLTGSACKMRGSSDVKNVYGADDRQPWQVQSVGLVGHGCTGTVVGKRLVLTAAHCVRGLTGTTFTPDGRQPIQLAVLHRGRENDLGHWRDVATDWAVLLAPGPMGLASFPIGYIHDDAELAASPAWVAGYANDRDDLTIAGNCAVKQRDGGIDLHDCDMMPGASGGPLLARYEGDDYIVGVQSAQGHCAGDTTCPKGGDWTWENSNLACDAGEFVDVVQNALSTYGGR